MRATWIGSVVLVLVGAAACGENSKDETRPGRPAESISRQRAAVPTEDLVRAGTTVPHPAGAWEIALDEDGSIVVERGDGTFAAFWHLLGDRAELPSARESDGTSRVNVVLRVHPRLPWEVVLWVVQELAAPPMKAYRLHFAVRPEQGDTEGSLAAWLPRDRGARVPAVRVERSRDVHVLLLPDEREVDPGAALLAFQRAFASAGARAGATIAAPPPGRVAAGHVLRTIDLLYRAGFESVQFEGQELPQQLLGPKPAPGDWLREYVESRPLAQPGYLLKVGDVRLTGQVGATPVPLPPAPPHRSPTPPESTTPNEVFSARDEHAEVAPPGVEDQAFRGKPGGERPGDEPRMQSTSPVGAFAGRRNAIPRGPGPGGQSRKGPAVLHALRWLALHQSENGGWEAAGFDRWCEGKPYEGERPDGHGDPAYDVGVTGLALCAFLGAGYTNRGDHEFAKTVRKGLAYLKGAQDKDGCYGARTSPHFVYNHAAAALAMVEAYGMTESPIFRGSAQKAVDSLLSARNPLRAWRYGVKPGDDDTSVTGWMTMVLQSARLINADAVRRNKPPPFPNDDEAFAGVKAWLDAVTDPATGRVGYLARGTGPSREASRVAQFPPEKSEGPTAIGVLARVFLGEDAASSDAVKKGLDLCANLPPTWEPAAGSIDFCYWYFGTMAVFQLLGEPWKVWERALDTALIPAQRMDGGYCSFKGSWDPSDPWGPDGGRVYSTAMACMCLEVIYRYDRLAAKDR